MKKLVAATLLSASLCVPQVGSAWAGNQVNFPPPVTDEETDIAPQGFYLLGQ